MGRAHAAFAVRQAGYIEVMLDPSLVAADHEDLIATGDAAFEALLAVVEQLQPLGFHIDRDAPALAVSVWGFAHGLAVLHRRGSLGRHYSERVTRPDRCARSNAPRALTVGSYAVRFVGAAIMDGRSTCRGP